MAHVCWLDEGVCLGQCLQMSRPEGTGSKTWVPGKMAGDLEVALPTTRLLAKAGQRESRVKPRVEVKDAGLVCWPALQLADLTGDQPLR